VDHLMERVSAPRVVLLLGRRLPSMVSEGARWSEPPTAAFASSRCAPHVPPDPGTMVGHGGVSRASMGATWQWQGAEK